MTEKKQLKVLLCAPRGFCAGVDRAIQIVEQALEHYGPPVYVRHEIVHNKYVVDSLKDKGAIFVDELDEIPQTSAPVVFSAHGVARSVPAEARSRNMFFLDATCPLVSKVHIEAQRHHGNGRQILLIGHKGHPEVIGTMGQLRAGAVHLVETAEDARNYEALDPSKLAYVSQTTLSVDDTAQIVDILKHRFPDIAGPNKNDICYATTNRQQAVKSIAVRCDALIVVGAPNSSNSMRLVEVARREGCERAFLVERAETIAIDELNNMEVIGLTAGASAPEQLVEEVITSLKARFEVTVETITTARETVSFKLPQILRTAEKTQ